MTAHKHPVSLADLEARRADDVRAAKKARQERKAWLAASAPVADRSGSPALRSAVNPLPPLPDCPECNRGPYSCICGAFADDDEIPPARDVIRTIALLYPDTGWGLAERSALGMVKP